MTRKENVQIVKVIMSEFLESILEEHKKINKNLTKDKRSLIDSYDKIFYDSGLRKATISDIKNGKSDFAFSTLITILNSLGYTLGDFAVKFDEKYKKYIQERRPD